MTKEKKLKYLLRRRSASGDTYLYFRMPRTGKLIALPVDESTPQFKHSYAACLKTVKGDIKPGRPPASAAPMPSDTTHVSFLGGTVGKGIETYLASSSFRDKIKQSSQYTYRKALDVMRDHIGASALREYDLDAINRYSESLTKKNGASTADFHVFLFSNIWQECRIYPEFDIKGIPNPTLDATRRYIKAKNPAKPWNDDQQDKFMETAPPYLQLGYLMLHFLGQRGGDCVRVKWTDFDGKGILVAPEKGDDLEPDYLKCPKPLLDALKRAQKKRGDGETILVNSWGKPWTNGNSLSQAIRIHLIKIGLAKRFTKTISMHGLRKNAAINAADTDLGTAGIKATTLHKSDGMALYYAKKREQRRLNAKVVDAIDVMLEEKAAAKVRGKRAGIRRVK